MIAIALAALAIAAVCAVADGALLSCDAEEGRRCGILDAERTHRAMAVLRALGLATAGVAAALAFDLGDRAPLSGFLIAATIIVAGTLIGEGLPRLVGDAMGARALRPLASSLRVMGHIGRPVVAAQDSIDRMLQRVSPEEANEDDRAVAEQFHEVVAAEAEVSREEQSLLLGVFSLGETEVHEIMVPRVELVAIDRELPWSEVLDRVRSSEHARFPVYDETPDEVIGILYAKDVLPFAVSDTSPADDWTPLVRPAVFIPATKTLDAQLRDFQSSGTHIAIVVDEYGGTAGLVTIEDILAEIVGEIRDEYDVEDPSIESQGGVRWWVSGKLTLDELSEALNVNFRHEQVSTVGGLLYELLGRVPRAGETLTRDGFKIVIEKMIGRRVSRVYFERLNAGARTSGSYTVVPQP